LMIGVIWLGWAGLGWAGLGLQGNTIRFPLIISLYRNNSAHRRDAMPAKVLFLGRNENF